jgi:UDP-N-acetylglucosamine transferase subunit ALG13
MPELIRELDNGRRVSGMKICLACSPGGHLSEMMELKNVYGRYNHFFVTYRSADTIELAKKEKVHFLDCPRRHPILTILNILQSFMRFIKEKPDIVLTTGAGVALPMCYIAKLYRKKIIFIESFCRVGKPSLFGRLIYPIANLTIVQWEPLLKHYKGAKYGGSIFNFSGYNIDKAKIKNQIFVTAGTLSTGFDRLLKEIDMLIEKRVIQEKVIAQIGSSKYRPKNYEWFRFTSKEVYWDTMKESKIVITHGGVGSITNALKFNKRTIVVPRRKEFGEIVNNHQLEITRELERQEKIIAVYDIQDLEKALKRAEEFEVITAKNESEVAKIIGDYFGR